MTTTQLHALARQAGWPEPPEADAVPLYTVDRGKTWAVTGDIVIDFEGWDPEHRDDHALLLYMSFTHGAYAHQGDEHVVTLWPPDGLVGVAIGITFAAAVHLAALRALGVGNG